MVQRQAKVEEEEEEEEDYYYDVGLYDEDSDDASDSGSGGTSASDSEYVQDEVDKPKSEPRRRAKGKSAAAAASPKVPYRARVHALADTGSAISSSDNPTRASTIDQGVLARIKKALSLAQHPNTGEAEAKQAMSISNRLMSRFNILQSDILVSQDAEGESDLSRAGQSTVWVTATSGKGVNRELWMSTMSIAMTVFFDCKCYTERYYKCRGEQDRMQWTFYGLATNSSASAMAFEMCFNQAQVWCYGAKDAFKGALAKNSYLAGIANGLYDMAEDEKEAEEKAAIAHEKAERRKRIKEEEKARRKEVERLESGNKKAKVEDEEEEQEDEVVFVEMRKGKAPGTYDNNIRVKEEPDVIDLTEPRPAHGSAAKEENLDGDVQAEDSDSSDEGDAPEAQLDFEHEGEDADQDLEQYIETGQMPQVKAETKAEPSATVSTAIEALEKEHGQEDVKDAQWKSHNQLVVFRKNAESIAEQYIKTHKVKLGMARKFKDRKRDKNAYRKGKKDSKNMDVKRRRLD
ncbi:hypothetical protein IE81DRAFT_322436 [Ceraceosorus guamensis]|uniref:Uncharacterized protein n=1 Tax=Ceraceosorus guamensis TaxID=1522189 RepID=A0A316W0Z9_9BASI|nr:hypothetical protein IE81DRAFT_322436 [Ceraceosorus guamensis]PWN43369.1 hypothetical protein IE81DRAFT_322436 [Ceraceosorus guamensis]